MAAPAAVAGSARRPRCRRGSPRPCERSRVAGAVAGSLGHRRIGRSGRPGRPSRASSGVPSSVPAPSGVAAVDRRSGCGSPSAGGAASSGRRPRSRVRCRGRTSSRRSCASPGRRARGSVEPSGQTEGSYGGARHGLVEARLVVAEPGDAAVGLGHVGGRGGAVQVRHAVLAAAGRAVGVVAPAL